MRTFIVEVFFVALIALSPASSQGGIGCAPLLPWPEYTGIPADVNGSELRVVRARTRTVEALVEEFPRRRMLRSQDGGHSWGPSSIHSEELEGLVAASGSSRSSANYVSRDNGRKLLRSLDEGHTWAEATLHIRGLGPDMQDIELGITGIADLGATLYGSVQVLKGGNKGIGGSQRLRLPGVYVSRDHGDTWGLFTSSLITGSPVAVGDNDRHLIFGVSESGLVRSRDGGGTWEPVGQQAALSMPLELQSRKRALRRLQENGGAIPDYLHKGIAAEFYQIEVTEVNQTVYVRSNRGLLISHDLGKSWCLSKVGAGVMDSINGLAISDSKPQEVFASTRRARGRPATLYFSDDGGVHFRDVYAVGENSKRSASTEGNGLPISRRYEAVCDNSGASSATTVLHEPGHLRVGSATD